MGAGGGMSGDDFVQTTILTYGVRCVCSGRPGAFVVATLVTSLVSGDVFLSLCLVIAVSMQPFRQDQGA